ncbi:transcription factor, partial [Sarracenia purpurea var. burkii]
MFLCQEMASGMFRLIAGVCRTMTIANTGGFLTLFFMLLLGGFILPKDKMPKWWEWGYWVSPLSYAFNALMVNEMFAPRWMNKLSSDNATSLGLAVLRNFDVFPERKWFWIGAAALLGFTVLFNVLFTLALTYLDPLGKPQAIISKEAAREMEADREETEEAPRFRTNRSKIESVPRSLSAANRNNSREMTILRMSIQSNANGLSRNEDSSLETTSGVVLKRGMVLPFTPLAMSFDSVNYFVDMPA